MKLDIRELLSREPLLFDGAAGTYLRAQPGCPPGPVELCCLNAPERVFSMHRAYIQAGCRAIKTHTFAAHVGFAAQYEKEQRDIITAAYALACRAAQQDVVVFADIGPAPGGVNAAQAYIAMADVFLDLGADCFLFETLASDEGIGQALAHIRSRCADAFIIVSFAADPDGFTRSGEAAASLIARVDALGTADAIGLNCVCGAYHLRRQLALLPPTRALRCAMPNAGYPRVEEGRTCYDSDPVYYARQVAQCCAQGARIVGGCCGTTPEYIRQAALALRKSHGHDSLVPPPMRTPQEQEKRDCQSRILQSLHEGRRPILVELDPPRDADTGKFIAGAQALARAGADAITIADCPIGRARMDSSLLACKLHRELGIEALPHMTCRDRNVNATQALLLGLSMEAVHNVLVVTGDPVPAGDRGSVKSVFQFNSRVLAKFIGSMVERGESQPFFVCGALNVNAVRFDRELERAADKEACGVQAFLTQPVLSERAAQNMEQARAVLHGYLFGGLFPVVSEKNACFLQSEVPGIVLDDAVRDAYIGLDRAQGEEMAVRLCMQAAKRIAPFVDGYYIMTPFQRVSLVERIMQAVQAL